MAATIASEDAVRAVAFKIMQTPHMKLTNDSVIEMLGGGSKQTIAPLLKKIREEFAQNGGADAVPTHLQAEAETLIKRLYEAAIGDARRHYEADTMRMGRILSGLQSDLDAATDANQTAEAQALQLRGELNTAEQEIEDLKAQIVAVTEGKVLFEASARTAHKDLERAAETIAALKARLDDSARVEERLNRLETMMPKSNTRHA